MPIDLDRFEDAVALRDPPTSERILRFLLEHGDKAYTRREIADAVDASPETVGTNLTRLKERGLVRHREPYWALTDDREHAVDYVNTTYDGALSGDLNQSQQPTDADSTSGDNDEAPPSVETITRPHREAAETFVERLHTRLDDAIDACYLFGSVARDDATADSDVDVLVVIADDADYATVDDQLLDLAYDVQLEYEVRVEVHSIRAAEFATRKERGDPVVRTAVEEGESIARRSRRHPT